MQYTTLGATGLVVSRLALGTWTFTALQDSVSSPKIGEPSGSPSAGRRNQWTTLSDPGGFGSHWS